MRTTALVSFCPAVCSAISNTMCSASISCWERTGNSAAEDEHGSRNFFPLCLSCGTEAGPHLPRGSTLQSLSPGRVFRRQAAEKPGVVARGSYHGIAHDV